MQRDHTQAAPALSIPTSPTPVQVSLIDSTTRMQIPAGQLLTPQTHLPEGLILCAPSYSFLIEHPSGRKLLFDLGLRKDWRNLTPNTRQFFKDAGWEVTVAKNVDDILRENGVALAEIEAVIWSHHHFDHRGDMTSFPASTRLIVGQGFQENYLPGFPVNPDSSVLQEECVRHIQEISFDRESAGLAIGGFRAVDFFCDGSFYILDCLGHTYGHIGALARVTANSEDASQNSFVFMGGDTCHFAGQFRPTAYRPLPGKNHCDNEGAGLTICPGAVMEQLLSKHSPNQPLFQMPEANAVDVETAHESIGKLQVFDAADNVLVVIAHDASLLGEVDFYPAAINDWKEKGFGEKVRWGFINSLAGSQ